MSNLVTQSEFASKLGCSRAYVTQLKKSGRLVMSQNKVAVDESIKRIEETKDPNRDDVRDRHALSRQADEQSTTEEMPTSGSYQAARAQKEKYLALQAKADYEKAIKELVKSDDVKHAAVEIAVLLRTSLENIPDLLSAELAPIDDPMRIHAILVEQVEQILTNISSQSFKQMLEVEFNELLREL